MSSEIVSTRQQRIRLAPVVSLVLSLGASAPVLADDRDPDVLEEVIVTAQKREQSLQDVGIAVTALTGRQLTDLGVRSTTDLSALAPSLRVRENFGGAASVTTVTIRGVSQNDFSDHHEPPNAVYVDGAYNSFLGGVGFQMFDVDRIEVLRGPQGTLYGRNATGGVLHLITRRPTPEFEAYIDLSGGEYGLFRYETAISGPFGDRARGRLSVAGQRHNGWLKNDIGPDSYTADGLNARGQVELDVTDSVQLLLNLRGGRDDKIRAGQYTHKASTLDANGKTVYLPSDGDNSALCGALFGVSFPPGTFVGTDCGGYRDADGDPLTGSYDFDGFFDRKSWGATSTLTWKRDELALTWISDYFDLKKSYEEDSDASPNDLFVSLGEQDARQFTQELRLNYDSERLHWVAGLYYLDIKGDYASGFRSPNFFGFDNVAYWSQKTKSWAVFGQAEYKLTEQFSVIAGARYTEDKKTATSRVTCTPDCSFLGVPTETVLPNQSRKDTDYAAKIELDWRPMSDLLVYGSVTRGNKAGGFNFASFSMLLGDNLPYEPEVLTDYEIGFKSTLAGGRVRLNANAFHYDYKDYQAFAIFGQFFTNQIFNADATINGLEAELQARLGQGWTLILGGSWLDTKVKDVRFGPGDFRDVQTPDTPKFSASGVLQKVWSIGDGNLTTQLDATYLGARQQGTLSDDEAGRLPSYTLVNARISYGPASGRWEAAVFARNLMDRNILLASFDSTTSFGGTIQNYGPPQWFGAEFRISWK